MRHTFNIDTYQDLEEIMESITRKYCQECQMFAFHLKCGFEKHNERWECLNC